MSVSISGMFLIFHTTKVVAVIVLVVIDCSSNIGSNSNYGFRVIILILTKQHASNIIYIFEF